MWGREHFRDERPSAVFRERGFAVSEEVYGNYSSEQVVDEEKYEEELLVEDYVEEEVSEEFAAMITVEYDTMGQGLDGSEFVAVAKEAHTIHLDSCCTRHMTGFYNLAELVYILCSKGIRGSKRGETCLLN